MLQRFGVEGGVLSEPEVRRFRLGAKLSSSSANSRKELRSDWHNACSMQGPKISVIS